MPPTSSVRRIWPIRSRGRRPRRMWRLHSRRCRKRASRPLQSRSSGGTGALGYGLALRWANAGVPVVIGSRSAERAERGGRAAARGRARGRRSRGWSTRRPRSAARWSFSPFPSAPSRRTSTTCAGALEPGQLLVDCTVPLAAAVGGKATRSLGRLAGLGGAAGAGDGPRWGNGGRGASHGQRPGSRRPRAELDEDVLICGDRKADKAQVAQLVRADPRPASRQRRSAGDRPHRRAADPAADLDQQPLQVPRRDPHHRAARRRSLGRVRALEGRTARRRQRRRQARRRDAGADRRRPLGDRQHRRRHRDARRPRLSRPRPGHLLALGGHRRAAGLGNPRATASSSSSSW